MRRILGISVIAVLALLCLGCGAQTGVVNEPPNTIEMGMSEFIGTTTLTVPAGTVVHFVDPQDSGGIHYLVTGTQGVYMPAKGAPDVFNNPTGLVIHAGETKDVQFATKGSYAITCTIHPAMQVQITVT